MDYKRISTCECSGYIDILEADANKRKEMTEYWANGFIYKNGESHECTCHRKYRLIGRYDRFAKNNNLPLKDELLQMSYQGAVDIYKNKLKALPERIKEKNLKGVLLFFEGPVNCQKTTTAAKTIYNVISNNGTAEYISFADLLASFEEKEDMSYLLDVDWLVIDDLFENSPVTVRTIYNNFYNLILKRSKPTVLVSNMNREEILESKSATFYNASMLKRMFMKIDDINGHVEFRDDVAKANLMKKGAIDLWGDSE